MSISISCVIYDPDEAFLQQTLDSLHVALQAIDSAHSIAIDLIDNGPPDKIKPLLSWQNFSQRHKANYALRTLQGHGNIGFGAAHNLSISTTEADYHLILNPDVILHADTLAVAIHFMNEHPESVLLAPESRDPRSGQLQFQCKQFPGLVVLALRFLHSARLNRLFASRLDEYEERANILARKQFEPTIISGCFMLFRSDALKKLNGFDERFFLYFEDFDLSLRAKSLGRVIYHPGVKIEHYGGGAGRKGAGHIIMFLKSALSFFRLHGWKIF